MSEEKKENKVLMQVVISCLENGSMNVQGDIDNLVQVLGLLECAKDVLKAHHAREAARIQAEERRKQIPTHQAIPPIPATVLKAH